MYWSEDPQFASIIDQRSDSETIMGGDYSFLEQFKVVCTSL
jgi:hypothetical protein